MKRKKEFSGEIVSAAAVILLFTAVIFFGVNDAADKKIFAEYEIEEKNITVENNGLALIPFFSDVAEIPSRGMSAVPENNGGICFSTDAFDEEPTQDQSLQEICTEDPTRESFVQKVHTESPTQRENTEKVYYCTATGKKYHLSATCRYIKNRNYTQITYEEVVKRGLEPCSECAAEDKNDK